MAPRHQKRSCDPAFQTTFLGTSLQHGISTSSKCPLRMSLDTQAPFPYPKRVSRSVVWFRDGDLRLEDHTGLESACEHTSHALAPLFVLTPKTKPASLQAARRLRKELRDRGSDLILRFAEDEATGVIQFLTEFGAERVHVRMDVEYEARDVVYQVERCLDGVTSVQTWDMELREWDGSKDELGDMPDVFPDFLRWKKRLKTPVAESSVLFQPDRIIPGPDLYEDDRLGEVDILVEEKSNMSEQQREFMSEYNRDMEFVSAMEVDLETERYGEFVVREYLRKADAYEKVDLGRSFAEVFRQGALAPARIFEIVHEHERKNGRIWRWAYREGAKMILDWLDAREFATLMARRDVANGATVDGEHEAKFWRWNGYLMRYVEEGRDSEGAKNKPPLLLVHGFGASSQHFRRSLKVLKERYHVYAVDLVGFGRSEKPPMQYTQALWECLLWDFVRDVIRKPVFVAGNSIGGYIACAFGADAHPSLCAGICLINSAGKLVDVTSEEPTPAPKKDSLFQYVMKRSKPARTLAGKALLESLRGRIGKTLKMVYPTNPDAADDQLAEEIRRNSYDYGAVEVLASGLILPPPRSLSELLQKFNGPLLVFQGELDPLNNTRQRADRIQQQYPSATIVRVQAGHCPHEEDAEGFVHAISTWMDSSQNRDSEVQFAETSDAAVAVADESSRTLL